MKKDFTIDLIEFPSKSKKDFEKTRNFMKNVFNWDYISWGDDYMDTAAGGITNAFNADDDHKPEMPIVVIFANNLEQAKLNVEENGGKIVKDIFAFPGGRRFHFIEPSGNLMAIWSDN